MDNVILDLDDFAENKENSEECLQLLLEQKSKFPNLKVTLFAIPYYLNKDNSTFFHSIKYDWIQFAIHGFYHHLNECTLWDYNTALQNIQTAYNMGCFVKGFKAPNYRINKGTIEALNDLGFWVDELEKESKRSYNNHPWRVHGHTWNAWNGIKQVIERNLWNENTKFHFINDIMEK